MNYDNIITTTAQRVAPFVVDAFHNSSVLAGRVFANVKQWNMGQYETQPLQVAESSTGGFFTGMGTFDTSDVNTDINLKWLSKGFYQNITLSKPEISLNNTEAGVINLTKRKMDVAKAAAISQIGTALYGLGAGDAFEGLQLQTDNATYSSSYGTQSRTTYGTYINGQVTAASGGVISFATLGAQVDLCSAAANTDEATNLILTTKTIWTFVETLVQAYNRGNYSTKSNNGGYMKVTPYSQTGELQAAVGQAGFDSYYFRGIPVVKDDKCPTGLVYTLNENYLKFVSLPLVGLKSIDLALDVTKGALASQPKASAFQLTDERMPVNAIGTVQQIISYGNFVNYNPKRSGVITGVTGI